MTKYYVCVTYDASVTVEVEADSAEEARDKAMEQAPQISLCHQCAHRIDLCGDPMKVSGDPWTDTVPAAGEPGATKGEGP